MLKKVIFIIVIIILFTLGFIILNKKERVERCLIAYMDHNAQIQQTYVYDIAYNGLFNKKVLKINTTKSIVSFDYDEVKTKDYYDEFEEEGSNFKKAFSKYKYDLDMKNGKNINVSFKSELYLQSDDLESFRLTEYKQVLDKYDKINFNKLKGYYKNQGANCKNVK